MTKYIQLDKIVYPVFLLGEEQPLFVDGVCFYSRTYIDQDANQTSVIKIVDDKNLPAPTLAKRRLSLLASGVKLKRIGTAVFFLGDLIKLATAKRWFVDSSGLVFKYTKSTTVKLMFKPIELIHSIPSGGAIIKVKGIPSRFKCLYEPEAHEIYAGVLKIGLSYILYGVYDTLHDDTRRKI